MVEENMKEIGSKWMISMKTGIDLQITSASLQRQYRSTFANLMNNKQILCIEYFV